MTQQIKHLYEFGPYRIDPAKRLLLRGEESIQLASKVFETLLVLVQHSEEVVSKDDLLKTVWPDSFVEESNLSQSIFLLRKALGETAQDHRYIVTIFRCSRCSCSHCCLSAHFSKAYITVSFRGRAFLSCFLND